MNPILQVEHLQKSFDTFSLHDISFSLPSGYIMGLIGRNGAGKTTLLRTIQNLYEKETGTVTVNGCSMEQQEKLAKDQIGFIMDENFFTENFSIKKNGRLYGSLYSHYNHKKFLTFCQRFRLNPDEKLKHLSKGQFTCFQLAFALSHDSRLFLMDEPFNGLDPAFHQELIQYMQEIVEDGTKSILFSTHFTQDLDTIGDYILLMDHGTIYLQTDLETLRETYRLYFGSKDQLSSFPKENILAKIEEPFQNSILVKNPCNDYFSDLQMKIPTLEELMYYLQKGGHIS